MARCSIRSSVVPLVRFSILLPRCLVDVTHGRSFPHSLMFFTIRSVFKKDIHFVLHFLVSGLVLNDKLCTLIYAAHVSTISCSPSSVGDSSIMSSAYPNMPTKSPLTQHPDSFLLITGNNSSMYTQNRIADSTAPCLTPFLMTNLDEVTPFHFRSP